MHSLLTDDEPSDEGETALQIYEANRSGSDTARVSDAVWETLSRDARKGWASIPADQRTAILRGKPAAPSRKVNLASQERPSDEDSDDDASESYKEALQVHKSDSKPAAKTEAFKAAHPADPARMMSQSKTTGNAQRSGNVVQRVVATHRLVPSNANAPPVPRSGGDVHIPMRQALMGNSLSPKAYLESIGNETEQRKAKG